MFLTIKKFTQFLKEFKNYNLYITNKYPVINLYIKYFTNLYINLLSRFK